jgi:membrane-associated protease RseP (regulator of RpoE activity)
MTRRVVGLWLATWATTTLAGMFHGIGYHEAATGVWLPFWASWGYGLAFSAALHGIIGLHESAHLVVIDHYRIRWTGPYFIPAPFLVTGTLGATIRVAGPFPSRRALFDVALSGPLAGFAAAIVILLVSMGWSAPSDASDGLSRLGQPWLALAWQKYLYSHQTVVWHPVAVAGWIGLVMTGVNLLPYGSFDGGQIVSALIGAKRAQWVSYACWIPVTWQATHLLTWLFVGVVMLLTGPAPSPVSWLEPSLGRARWWAGLLAAVVGAVCWLHREPGVLVIR